MDYISAVQNTFKSNANHEFAFEMSKYMRNLFPFLGIKKPERAAITNSFFKKYGFPPISDYEEIVKELYALEEREYHYFALDLCLKMKKYWNEESLYLFEWLILNKSWWDTVDLIASKFVGTYFMLYANDKFEITNAWNKHENFWLKRTSIIFQLNYKEKTDEQLLFQFCLNNVNEQEFFIRKAIGWALRQYARYNPTLVKDFVMRHNFSGLTKREALKHF